MPEDLTEALLRKVNTFKPGNIVEGRIVELAHNHVLVDVGYKTEGFVPRNEFKDFETLEKGQEIKVMLESLDLTESGLIPLSKERADLVLNWNRIESACREGTKIKGKVVSAVKGGFRVDIGILAFLPGSQADTRPITDPKSLVSQVFEFKVIKLDRARNNVVVSRRDILEEEDNEKKRFALERIEVGQVMKGTVRNIVDYGVFVDLGGGLTGLVHINDLSWSRITHPSQAVAVNEEVEVKILRIDPEKAEVSLGIKQIASNPWENVQTKYPIGSKVTGKVVNLTDYGAFVKLEDGVEGLLHISELSWTVRVKHPSEILAMGDNVEVQIIALEPEKQKISFSMKALEPNPWETIAEKYPIGTTVKGKVYNLTRYGAFVEIEKGIEGLLHVKDLDWAKIKHPSEILKKGEKVEVVVLGVDQEKRRIALGRKQLIPMPAEQAEVKSDEEKKHRKAKEETTEQEQEEV